MLRQFLKDNFNAGQLLASASLAWVEVTRTLRGAQQVEAEKIAHQALSGISEIPLDPSILMSARSIGSSQLRSLDAIHLAAAFHIRADALLTYDLRLAQAALEVGLSVCAPGSQPLGTN